jgi:sugar O-acyltransferase (sialic acid O-acetyltransferase NeuD family)
MQLRARGIQHFFVGLGSISDPTGRRLLFERGIRAKMRPVSAIHPRALLSASAQAGRGLIMMAGAIVNACSVLGQNVIVNTGAIIEHDCLLGDHVHVATGARLCGTVHLDDNVHIGAGATIKQGIHIGKGSVVGAGSVVVKNVSPRSVVAGVPALPLKRAS